LEVSPTWKMPVTPALTTVDLSATMLTPASRLFWMMIDLNASKLVPARPWMS
jgi:hypothetical protein